MVMDRLLLEVIINYFFLLISYFQVVCMNFHVYRFKVDFTG